MGAISVEAPDPVLVWQPPAGAYAAEGWGRRYSRRATERCRSVWASCCFWDRLGGPLLVELTLLKY